MNNLWWVLIGMALVTYLPRLIPMTLLAGMKIPPETKRFLEYIPYAALGALIFPGIIYSTGDNTSAIAGAITAAVAAWFKLNLLLVLVISVFTVWAIKIL